MEKPSEKMKTPKRPSRDSHANTGAVTFTDQQNSNRSRSNSLSSHDSELNNPRAKMPKRYAKLETFGRCMFLFSVAFFIVGVLITVFGFNSVGVSNEDQLPLKIIGPACLGMTILMWAAGCGFSRLWNSEWKRQQQAFELRDKVRLHAMAMDFLQSPMISPNMLHDPRLRRQLLLKLRQQKALDLSSTDVSETRRPSRASTVESKRRYSTVAYQREIERKMSRDYVIGDSGRPPFELPGIQISRFETVSLGEGRASIVSTGSRNSRQYIIIHSDFGSDYRLSDYSLCGSRRSSRSTRSRASSQVSSRIWDFSPRESDWDADISVGSRGSLHHEWGGGPEADGLSPIPPKRLSVVTFNMGSPSFRRHSSPAGTSRRKDSDGDPYNRDQAWAGGNTRGANGDRLGLTQYDNNNTSSSNGGHTAVERQPRSCMMTVSERSAERERLLERERSVDYGNDERHGYHSGGVGGSRFPRNNGKTVETSARKFLDNFDSPDSPPPTQHHIVESGLEETEMSREKLRPPLRRNNTDDSEVERRVARLFKEIEYSLSESVDESRIHSSDYETTGAVESRETQTLGSANLDLLTIDESVSARNSLSVSGSDRGCSMDTSPRRSTASMSETSANSSERALLERGQRQSKDSGVGDEPLIKVTKSTKRRSRLSVITTALASLGITSRLQQHEADQEQHPMENLHSPTQQQQHPATSQQPRPSRIHPLLLFQGLSGEDRVQNEDIELGQDSSD